MRLPRIQPWLGGRMGRPTTRPLTISIETSERCNLRCRSCRGWRNPAARPDLGPQRFERILTNLRGLEGSELALIGAEPTLNPHLGRLVALARRRGFGTRLFSNGMRLAGPLQDELIRAGLGSVTLSLDGGRAATHDWLRGRAGSFDAVRRTMQRLGSRHRGIRATVCMVVSRHNYRQIPEVLRLAADLHAAGCALHWVSQVPDRVAAAKAVSRQYAFQATDFLLRAEQVGQLRRIVAHRRPRMGRVSRMLLAAWPTESYTRGTFPVRSCRYTAVSLNLDVVGRAYPCGHYRRPMLGDLTRRHWRQVWRSEPRRQWLAGLARELPPVCAYCCHHVHNLTLAQGLRVLAGRRLGGQRRGL